MGVDKRFILPLFLFLSLGFTLFGQEEDSIDNTSELQRDYYYELDEKGDPVFKQVLSWKAQRGVLEYEVILESLDKKGSGSEILRQRTPDNSLTVSLVPGQYRYRIIIFNMLGKAEVETGWSEFEVIKAEFPEIDNFFPFNLYVEEGVFKVTLHGRKILPGAEYQIVDSSTGMLILRVSETDRNMMDSIDLDLTEKISGYGNYRIKVINPGGLQDTSDMVLKVRYKKPVDIILAAGYSPTVPLYNGWFTKNWNEGIYPVGFLAHIDVYFVKKRYGFFGAGLSGRYLTMEGGTAAASLSTMYTAIGVNFLYKYLITPQFHIVFRLGGGAANNTHGFDYTGSPGPEMTSWDPYGAVGLSLQAIFLKRIVVEPGVELFNVFHKTYTAGMLCPFVSAGVYF